MREGWYLRATQTLSSGGSMTSYQIYLFGFIILIIGLAAAAFMLGVPPLWIGIGVIILIGIGIMASTNRSNRV